MDEATPTGPRYSPSPRRWRGKWLAPPGDATTPNSFACFRREFTWSGPTAGAQLVITADRRYRVWVNDTLVGDGPPLSPPHRTYFDRYNIGHLLREGPNCLAAVAHYVSHQPGRQMGLLAEVVDGAGQVVEATSDRWRVLRRTPWSERTYHFRMNIAAPWQEVYNAGREPVGWRRPGFADGDWAPPLIVTGRQTDRPGHAGGWSRLLERDIPFPTADPVYPVALVYCEECLDLLNRMRPEDASIQLSMPGRPVETSRLENAEALLGDAGETLFETSVEWRDKVTDGRHDPCVVVDFGRIITGYVRLDVAGPRGAKIMLGYAERLLDGHFNNSLEGQFADTLILGDEPLVWQPLAWRAFRYLKLRVNTAAGPVRLKSLTAVVTRYPFADRGRFESSDETLNAVWEMCRYTLRLSAVDSLMDTPWREQAQWLGDVAAVTVPAIYACFGDTALAAKFYRQAAASQYPTGFIANMTSHSLPDDWPNVLVDYSLWWLSGVWRHYLYLGEVDWLRELWPTVVKVLVAFLTRVNEHGQLEDVPHHTFIDWAHVDRRGECAALNALLAGALEAAGAMAEVVGDEHWRELAASHRALLAASFTRRYWDPARGVFADCRVEDELSARVSEQTNLAAIRWGLADAAQTASILERFYGSEPLEFVEAQPFFMVVVLEALTRASRRDLALRLIRERWGERMIARGATSCHEEWGVNHSWRSGTYAPLMRTLSHAWSACPAEWLITGLTGLTITAPGCRAIRLAPLATEFDYVATFPTPRGPVEVACRNGRVTLTAPEGVSVSRADCGR